MANNRKKSRVIGKILFVLYIVFLIYFLIFSEWYGREGATQSYRYNLVLFKEIRRFWEYRDQLGWYAMFANIFGNVIVFLPFGYFLPMSCKYRSFFETIFYSFALSFCVESFQLISKVGSFDVDDILLNTVGGILGYIIFEVSETIRRRHGNKKS